MSDPLELIKSISVKIKEDCLKVFPDALITYGIKSIQNAIIQGVRFELSIIRNNQLITEGEFINKAMLINMGAAASKLLIVNIMKQIIHDYISDMPQDSLLTERQKIEKYFSSIQNIFPYSKINLSIDELSICSIEFTMLRNQKIFYEKLTFSLATLNIEFADMTTYDMLLSYLDNIVKRLLKNNVYFKKC